MKFFHLPKGKKFSIPNRFYDPRKEAMKDREARMKAELGLDKDEDGIRDSGYRSSVKGSFRKGMKGGSFANKERAKSNFRLFLIIAALAILAYVLLK